MAALLFTCFVVFPASLFIFHLATKKYVNKWKLIFYFAKKGGGKTTMLTKQAIQHLKRGWTVYTTFPVPGCYLISYKDIGLYEFEKNSLIVIDEVGMIWDNRNHKDFPPHVRDWFKLQRHRHCKVILASQHFDVDIKIRNLCDSMFLLENRFRIFTYGKRILRSMDIVEATGNAGSESRIVDQLRYDTLLLFWAGSRVCAFIPAWVKYFDSFDAPPLEFKEWPQLPPLQLDDNERFVSRQVKKINFLLKNGAERMGCTLRRLRGKGDD